MLCNEMRITPIPPKNTKKTTKAKKQKNKNKIVYPLDYTT